MKQTVRIIGGQYRGKKLHFPEIDGLRPTPDRVKETLFNWLMNDIRGARCLDAFAGSGALGFEAYSRGAEQVVFVEASAQAYSNLKHLASSFQSDKLIVIQDKAENYLQKALERFDIIFLDPPFAKNHLPQCINLLASSELLVNGGLLYIESEEKQQVDSSRWLERKSKQAGQVSYSLYEKIA
ncbi:Ribosomal RNA small subunit methyltransferase D [Legionella massiliensis]|uniref:Ribosomal RNA small subunit methyltransferase D n=1 Tax=Legionella massiliensis TaxID=1034943 RepID=A0A078KXV8_9GAMM|nr:16S rRNA (guanine(966)-N(2))-methyltransferase RsmD [Legionella massiliensis]CDZ77857.1 Ribosomal RNA small subunit methyltransferase D [Legionella massiliensis]CEE13595.1 Ribosomal RNA small subunit methyltransferase D [Legionella massiliensis]